MLRRMSSEISTGTGSLGAAAAAFFARGARGFEVFAGEGDSAAVVGVGVGVGVVVVRGESVGRRLAIGSSYGNQPGACLPDPLDASQTESESEGSASAESKATRTGPERLAWGATLD